MKIETWQSVKDGRWYFHRKARNGKITDPSQGYATESSARRGLRRRYGQDVKIIKIADPNAKRKR